MRVIASSESGQDHRPTNNSFLIAYTTEPGNDHKQNQYNYYCLLIA